MAEIFRPQTNQYNLRSDYDFKLPQVSSVTYSLDSVRFRGPRLWCTIPLSIRQSTNQTEFKAKIKTWKKNEYKCLCRLCKKFIPFLGFL